MAGSSGEPRYNEAKGSENLLAITRFLYIELFSISCIITGVKKKTFVVERLVLSRFHCMFTRVRQYYLTALQTVYF